jgi:hypothetical protein
MNATSSSNLARGEIRRQVRRWDDNRVFLENDKLDVAVKSGRLVVAHLPAIALSTSTPK